jgi:hypothetical protein
MWERCRYLPAQLVHEQPEPCKNDSPSGLEKIGLEDGTVSLRALALLQSNRSSNRSHLFHDKLIVWLEVEDGAKDFLSFGFAAAFSKPVIELCQKRTMLRFDLDVVAVRTHHLGDSGRPQTTKTTMMAKIN